MIRPLSLLAALAALTLFAPSAAAAEPTDFRSQIVDVVAAPR
jgi:hypothetical protein